MVSFAGGALMRAATSLPRPQLFPRSHPRSRKPRSLRHGSSNYLLMICAAMLVLGYLPGIFLGHDGHTSLGQQLALYYANNEQVLQWPTIFINYTAGPFLQIVFVLLCGFSALGSGFLLLYFLSKGIFLGFCAANLFFAGGVQDLVAYWFWTCLPDLIFTAVNLWLTGYALCLSQGVFQSVFLGGAPRGQLNAASRRLLVRSGITLFISGLIGIIFSGLRLLLGSFWG